MSKFLDDFLITIPSTQRKKILELLELRQNEGKIRSSYELQIELERLLSSLNERQNGPTFQGRLQSGKIESKTYNENMEEIAFDLATLFEASATIDRLLNDNKQLSRSLLSNIKKNIYSLQSKIERYKLLMKNTDGFIDGVHEQFISPEYTETDEKSLQIFRKDRFDRYLDKSYSAESIGEALQLAGVQTIDQLQTSYGRRLAKIHVKNRTGQVTGNPEHSVDKAIDGSLDTFWAENILVDQVITQNVSNLWEYDKQNIPRDGAFCELEITLNGVTTVSDIQFDPFCSYPLEIVSIYGYESEDRNGIIHELVSPNHENPHQRSKKSVSLMTFQFPSVDVSKLRILIRQENYVKENFIVNKDDLQNMQLWRKLSSSTELIEDAKNPNETMAEFDKKNEITGWSVYLEKLGEWAKQEMQTNLMKAAENAMEAIRMGDYKNPMLLKLQAMNPAKQAQIADDKKLSQSWQATNKLSYLYGAYNISVFGRKYLNESIYITKPLPLSSNATRFSIDTVEKHYDIDVGSQLTDPFTKDDYSLEKARITDIEYYITTKKNPTATDWHPILPISKTYVQGELLSGDLVQGEYPEFEDLIKNGTYLIVYSFRFPVVSDKTVTLRRNGSVMSSSTYVISNDGKKIAILGKFYAPSSIYTVDYKPADGAHIVSLDESVDVVPTQFIGTDGETGEFFAVVSKDYSVTLKHTPYLFRNKLLNYNVKTHEYSQNSNALAASTPEFPIIVRVNGEEYKNITNYMTNSYDVNRLTENNGKTFAQIGEAIIFGTPEDGSLLQNITVDYYYVATDVRLKAILRRNSAKHESVTPALYSYHIRCQSHDQEV